MSRKFTYIIILAAVVSCERLGDAEAERIGVSAGVSELVVTRAAADPFMGSAPSEDNVLESAVWFSNSKTAFPHAPVSPTYLPCHTEIAFESSAITYADYTPAGSATPFSLTYPVDNSPVYCVGFHPADGWQCADGVNVSHAINGQDDLMFASAIEGTWDKHFKSLDYKHLLTWVKVSVCAMTMETARQWGKVTDVTIKCKSRLDINLSKSSANVTYGGEPQYMTIFNDPAGKELNLTSQELGSVLCDPATEYEVTIKTQNSTPKTLTVKLTDLDYNELTSPDQAAGKLFILSLYFNPFNIIEGTCTLNYWNDQNEDLFLTPPAGNL